MKNVQVQVNGATREVAPGTTLAALLSSLEIPLQAVAVAVNLEVVPRARYAHHILQPGDRIEVVRAVGGG